MRKLRAANAIAAILVGLAVAWVAAVSARADRRVSAELPAVVRIEAGWFTMGSSEDDVAFAAASCRAAKVDEEHCAPALFVHEQPARRVRLRSYRIDRFEVAHADYRRCARAGVCPPARVSPGDPRVGRARQPATGVRWADAQRYCAWVGGRLPTEAQWERAARGDDARRFPWGNHFHHLLANHGLPERATEPADLFGYAAPVDAMLDGRSPYGLQHAAGNAWELTADHYAADAYEHGPVIDPTGPAASETARRVMRGGSWRSPPHTLRVTHRAWVAESASEADVGFRCAYDAR
jgi:formylglycine-generating enzyme required for sulfatase activity